MVTDDVFSVHSEPVWRDRADFIINASLPEAGRFEQLWARQIAPEEVEVCCIPFFLYDVALGDVVRTSAQFGREYVLDHVARRSRRQVFRAFFELSAPIRRGEVAEFLTSKGVLWEWSSNRLLAIDAVDAQQASTVDACLSSLFAGDGVIYERGQREALD